MLPAFWTCTLEYVRDDGAVIYLNGTELVRSNLPVDEAINYQTFAAENITGGG